MIKKRYLVALGALTAAITACGSDIKPNGAATGGSSGTSNPGKGGSSGSAGSSGASGSSGTAGSSGASGSSGSAGSSGASGSSGSGGTSGTAGSSGAAGSPDVCVKGIPNTTQVPRLLNRQYDAAVRDLVGVTTLGSAGDPPSAQLIPDFDGAMLGDAWRQYEDVGSQIAHTVITGANKSKFITCDATTAACLDTTIRAFGRKAFRRPMTDAEVTSFQAKLAQITPAGTADEIAEAILYTFLVSPSFLLVPELDSTATDTATGAIQLSSIEVAARLSFLLWGSIPDDTLNAAADAKALSTKEQILEQATRMIAIKEKTGPMVSMFHRVNFALDNGSTTSHWWKTDHNSNPLYSSDLKTTYRTEMDLFFEDVAFSGGSFKDLFLSPVAFVNAQTAPIYGLDAAAYGADLTRVELDATKRPGFMTRIGFLSSFAHGASTSPILRGAYVTVNMIGVNPGAPDPSNTMKTIDGTFATERAYVEALTSAQDACKGCHIPMVNPPGIALENYDSIGKWQTVDPLGGNIDATADVTFSEGNIVHITSPQQLMQQIAATPQAKEIYAQLWVSYATGRAPNNNDQCLVDDINTKLSQDGYSVLDMLADVTQADSFRLRVQATP